MLHPNLGTAVHETGSFLSLQSSMKRDGKLLMYV